MSTALSQPHSNSGSRGRREHEGQGKRFVQGVLFIGAVAWCLAIILSPVFDLGSIYFFFSRVCHQLPGRTWHLYGHPLGLCIRCTSISFGFTAGLLLLRTANVRLLKIALVLTGIQWLLALTILDSEFLRVVSGVFLGAAAAPIIREGFEDLFTRLRTAHESM